MKNLTPNHDVTLNFKTQNDLNQNKLAGLNLTDSYVNSDNDRNSEYAIRNESSISQLNASSNMEASFSEEIIERFSCYVYYLNFSLNFFLYTLNSSKFKKILFN